MGSKIATILSLIFVVTLFLFASDMMCLQYLYSDLDSTAVTIGYLISKQKLIDDNFVERISDDYKVIFKYTGPEVLKYGEVVQFQVSKEFNPVIISGSTMMVDVVRTTVVGYYG